MPFPAFFRSALVFAGVFLLPPLATFGVFFRGGAVLFLLALVNCGSSEDDYEDDLLSSREEESS